MIVTIGLLVVTAITAYAALVVDEVRRKGEAKPGHLSPRQAGFAAFVLMAMALTTAIAAADRL